MEIEICINSESAEAVRQSVGAAHAGGADRVELCSAMHLEGLTPPEEHIRIAREAFGERPGLLVMIRPHGGGFDYTNEEIALMHQQIDIAAGCGADGVVLGVLKGVDRTIDRSSLNALVGRAHGRGMKVTFHRAFDATPDRSQALETLVACGVDRVLTSGVAWGAEGSALDGIEAIADLVRQSDGRIEIVAGGGLDAGNAGRLVRRITQEGPASAFSLHTYNGVLDNNKLTGADRVRTFLSAAATP